MRSLPGIISYDDPSLDAVHHTRYTLFQEASETGMPMMRPMWVHYPSDENTFAMDDQVRF